MTDAHSLNIKFSFTGFIEMTLHTNRAGCGITSLVVFFPFVIVCLVGCCCLLFVVLFFLINLFWEDCFVFVPSPRFFLCCNK